MQSSNSLASGLNIGVCALAAGCLALCAALGQPMQLPVVQDAAFAAILCIAAAFDIRYRRIPNACILGAIALRAACLISLSLVGVDVEGEVRANILGALSITAVLLACEWAGKRLAKRSSIGMGDVKLFGVVGLYFGFYDGLIAILVSCALGLASSRLRLFGGNGTFPFAPSIALACIALMAFGKVSGLLFAGS